MAKFDLDRVKILTIQDVMAMPETEEVGERFADWRRTGRGIAVYRNQALDSAAAGRRVFMSFGPDCSYKTAGSLPEQAPDGPWGTGWKYRLEAIVPRADFST